MRVFITLLVALFATLASAATWECAGKAIMAPWKGSQEAVKYMQYMVKHQNPNFPPAVGAGPRPPCAKVYCAHDTLLEWCTEENKRDDVLIEDILKATQQLQEVCHADYKGKVTGGVWHGHHDAGKWRIILQNDSGCKGSKNSIA
ncbi:hypothetical protein BJX99DRAFT_259683 [Aspergillus californicus]